VRGRPGITPWRYGARLVAGAVAVASFVVMTGGPGGGDRRPVNPVAGPTARPITQGAPGIIPGPPRSPVEIAELVTATPHVVTEGARFSPDTVVVPARRGVVLTVENRDGMSHSLRLRIPGADPVAVATGAVRVELRFRSPGPGVYRMTCDIHRAMRGTLHAI